MKRGLKRHSKKTGLPPETLLYTGDQREEHVTIDIIDYNASELTERSVSAVTECFSFKGTSTVTWINVEGVHNADIVKSLGDCYGIHPLVLEDIMNVDQRPKIEDYKEYLYIVLKMLSYDMATQKVSREQVSIVVGRDYVISFQEKDKPGDVFNAIRELLRAGKGRIRESGADYLVYRLIDAIVDQYFSIMENLGDLIEVMEEELVTNPDKSTPHKIHHLKTEFIYLRKSVWPLREVLARLGREDASLVSDSTRLYIRDVYDHVIQVMDAIETYRDILSNMLDIYLSSISNKMNEIMKVLTIISTLFIPLTFIVGLYGMNFRYMPELETHWGYPAVLSLMLLITLCMLYFFRRKNWI